MAFTEDVVAKPSHGPPFLLVEPDPRAWKVQVTQETLQKIGCSLPLPNIMFFQISRMLLQVPHNPEDYFRVADFHGVVELGVGMGSNNEWMGRGLRGWVTAECLCVLSACVHARLFFSLEMGPCTEKVGATYVGRACESMRSWQSSQNDMSASLSLTR